ncbi:MAG: hypothetical protein HKN68_13190 [Saprospiraceae bacterium]|nr:hypothetical protein [Saprospiraceae bacterium]
MSELLHLISGPRNISTALMYSFGNRPDTAIIDEPYYAYYLNKYQVAYHPGTDDILDKMSTDPQVITNALFAERPEQYFFIKNMAHHLQGFNYSFIHEVKNIFLIRNPRKLIASFAKVIEQPSGVDIGVEREKELYDEIVAKGKYEPIILDSGEVLKDPEGVLRKLCEELDIPFTEHMLSWPSGPRTEDGVWAKHWYSNVHQSTGFISKEQKYVELKEHLEDLYQEVKPHYDFLYQQSIKA